jgi:starvation-inducible DNA-binding protein
LVRYDFEVEKMHEKLISNLAVLYQKLRNFHWNYTGTSFVSVHKFLEAEYEALSEDIDELAEFIRAKDEKPLSTLKEFLDNTELKEEYSNDVLPLVIKDYEKIISDLDSFETEDKIEEDVLLGIQKRMSKSLWMLKSMKV